MQIWVGKSGRRYAEMRSVCVQLPRKQQMLTLVLSVTLLLSPSSCSLLCCSSPFLTAACWREGMCAHMHTHTHICAHTHAWVHAHTHTQTQFPQVTHAGRCQALLPYFPWGIGPLNPSRAPQTHLEQVLICWSSVKRPVSLIDFPYLNRNK